ncbi:MAG: PAS domain-containing protein [Proteobacteria bacterium]|nr:PAS domain-containing protein [Pseudomonadota bacterium]MBU1686504.1 PAS domain-containing protein [Pseudomonadota bacterium]
MKKQEMLNQTRLAYVSPWLLGAAVGLLLVIISIFAASNLRRGTLLLTEAKLQKGLDLIRFIEATARASLATGTSISVHVQQVIEQSAADPEIAYIAIIDPDGIIKAHNDPDKIDAIMPGDHAFLQERNLHGNYQIISPDQQGTKIFEVYNAFRPFLAGPRPMHRMRRNHQGLPGGTRPDQGANAPARARNPQDEWYPLPGLPEPNLKSNQLKILVGFDMTELHKLIRQHRINILFISLALLLVGLAGWLSLLTAQGYRVSQNTLKRIEAFTNLLISKLPDGIVATDATGRIQTVNKGMTGMTGVIAERVLNTQPVDSLPSSFHSAFALNPEEEMRDRQIRFLDQEGNSRDLLISSAPILDEEAVFAGRVLLVHDLTELKKLERKISRNDRFIALGKMAAGVAHEVRNPLSSIKGFATLLGSKFPEGSSEYEAARLLVSEATRLNRSISELLNYARPTPLEIKPVNLNTLVDQSLRLIRADAELLGIEICFQFNSELGEISLDPDRMKQVLLNLYLNSIQAMQAGGVLKVAIIERKDLGAVEIDVEDTGIGIAEEDLGRITDPYYTTKKDGTGLGLSMASKIIEEHGGSIVVTSKVNSGTQVAVQLPLYLREVS